MQRDAVGDGAGRQGRGSGDSIGFQDRRCRFSGGTHGYRARRAGSLVGGPIAFVKDGDPTTIDADKKELTLDILEGELAKRYWLVKPDAQRGVLAKYARTVLGIEAEGG